MEINATGRSLLKVFEEKLKYVIPDYQRQYSWTKPEIEAMINDLENAISNNTTHYFGAFVFNAENKDSNIIEIIDGQQRMTTVTLFLYALRKIYHNPIYQFTPGVEHRRNKLKEYLEFLDEDGNTKDCKLKLGELDNEFFNEYIVRSWNATDKERKVLEKNLKDRGLFTTSKRLRDAFIFVLEYLERCLNDAAGDIGHIKRIQDALLNSFEVVEITVKSDSDAFLIFETLNDRGLDLSAVDLIKNHLFKNCANSDNFDQAKRYWIEMIQSLGANSAKRYIRHYWISKHEHTTHQGLFKAVRNKTIDSSSSYSMIKELHDNWKYYDALNNPFSGVFTNSKLNSTLSDIHALGFDLTHPILLSGIARFRGDEQKLYVLARLCLNFLIRYVTVMRERPSKVEKDLGCLARELRVSSIPPEEAFKDISSYFRAEASDSRFQTAMETYAAKSPSYSTYFLLTEYERSLHKDAWQAPERKEITIEHILPKTAHQSDWGQFTPEQREQYVHYLGNLTLLGPSAQGRASNSSFAKKKEIYRNHTDMLMTQELLKYNCWNAEQIKKRQKQIAAKAVDIFTLKVEDIKVPITNASSPKTGSFSL